MNKDELLLPRYKVIAGYPGSHLKVGDILTYVGNNCFKCNDLIFHGSILTEHVHLFKKLEWHEDRAPEDLPKYARWASGLHANEVHKAEFDFTSDTLFLNNCASTLSMWIGHLIPATFEEYEAYQKTTKEQ